MSAHSKLEVKASKPAMDVAILYEDWGTGVRAKRTCDQLAEQVPSEVVFCIDLWRFDLLEEEALRAEAMRVAVNSDLLFISAHGHQALPRALNSWLQQWLVQRLEQPTGLVISLDASAQDSAAANQILAGWAQLAQSARVDLFLHFGHAPRRQPASPVLGHPAPAPLRSHSPEGLPPR